MSVIIELQRHIDYNHFTSFDPNGCLFQVGVDQYRDDMTDYFISSPRLDASTPEDRIQKAHDLGMLINGIFRIFQVDERLHLYTHRLIEDGWRSKVGDITVWPQSDTFPMPYSALSDDWRKFLPKGRPYISSETANFCALCILNESIRNIALTFGYLGVNWISPSSAIEHLNQPEKDMENRYAVSKTQISLFKRTANSFAVLGPAARHGKNNYEPPKSPMTLSDAKDCVFHMVRAEAVLLSESPAFKDFTQRFSSGVA